MVRRIIIGILAITAIITIITVAFLFGLAAYWRKRPQDDVVKLYFDR